MPEAAPVREISLAREMEESYLEYAMSTIISRALPDARDGLKPAQRRILMAMYDLRLYPNRQHLKSAKVAGQTSGDYHPHGEGIVYPTMVRLAQEFNMRYPLIEGQGNFGSIDGDPPAAMRYCVTGDALVVTDQGLIPIAQLSAGPEDIPIQVLSADGGVNTARKWFDCGEHPTWQVRTRHGYEIRGTANHPLLVCQPDEKGRPVFAWKTMEQIEVGDWLVLDRSENLWPEGLVDLSPYHPVFPPNSGVQPHPLPEKLKETLAFLLGALVAEATFQPHRIEFTLTPRDFAAAFYQAWRETFPTCRLHTWLRNPVSYGKRHFWQMQVVSQQVVAFLRNLGLQGQSTQRHIPEVVLRSPRQVVAAFLRGLFEGEGNPQRFGNSRLRISLCSRSQTLLKQVQVLLLRFGIASTRRPRGRNGGWLCITGLENLRRFAEQIGFVSEAKKEALADMLQVHSEAGLSQMDFVSFLASFVPQIAARHREWLRKHHFDRPARLARALPCLMQALPKPDAPWAQFLALRRYLFDPIVSLEYAGRHRVYSLRVDSDCHSFVANGFINHNTEVRLAPLAMEMLEDLDKDTVDFRPNYDERLEEPVVLPSKFPNLLCNGSEGIAVGMSTKIPPHNLNEVAEAICAYIDHPDIAVEELMEYIPGPDFPTQGIILGTKGIRDMYTRGRGSITLQARALIEEIEGGRTAIIITELPYQVNKAHLQEQIAALVNARRISGISAL
ncbi:MAG TPA: DNA gyrase subunit A, partial [Armatimonadetes bacterium]|nr:DNA gyrase subunit A [Armatimonadota bacterium]